MRILIAEDDQASQRELRGLLEQWGHEVIAVEDGCAAWEVLQEDDAPRMAIIEWLIPGKSALDICREVRNRNDRPYVYVVVLTRRPRSKHLADALASGADDWVDIPFNVRELQARLRAAERIIGLQRELVCARATLKEQAHHDPLTGLPNRLLFSDRLTQMMGRSERRGSLLAVMFIDLDNFKAVNDRFGHQKGDQILLQVAERLHSCLRQSDTFARMGGDEFTVLLGDVGSVDEVQMVARRILESLSKPLGGQAGDIAVTASIGISLFPSDGTHVETLVRNADLAMYKAKQLGKGGFQFYTAGPAREDIERAALQGALQGAISFGQFVLHYQPRVDLRLGAVVGAEALLRWHHSERGLLLPGDFLKTAEESGMIVPIGQWVLTAACHQAKRWVDAQMSAARVAVNLSAQQLQNSYFSREVGDILRTSGLNPDFLALEINESVLMHEDEAAARTLNELKDLGVQIVLDDFGTGYTSLNCMQMFPIDAVKIDASIVRSLMRSPESAAIAGAGVAMAHSLKLKAIAEGVETWEQLEFLRSLHCDEMQGYFVSRPVCASEYEALLRASEALPANTLTLAS